jgi:hypothetical protein
MQHKTGVNIMLRIILFLTAISLFAAHPALARPLAPGCNPAIQNWINGSGDTCQYISNGGIVAVERTAPTPPTPQSAPPPPVVEEDD